MVEYGPCPYPAQTSWIRPPARSRARPLSTVGDSDISFPTGVVVEVAAPASGGSLVYDPLFNGPTLTETIDAGGYPGVAGVPVLVKTIKGHVHGDYRDGGVRVSFFGPQILLLVHTFRGRLWRPDNAAGGSGGLRPDRL